MHGCVNVTVVGSSGTLVNVEANDSVASVATLTGAKVATLCVGAQCVYVTLVNAFLTLVDITAFETVAGKTGLAGTIEPTRYIGTCGKATAGVGNVAFVDVDTGEPIALESVKTGTGETALSVGTSGVGIAVVHFERALVDVEA